MNDFPYEYALYGLTLQSNRPMAGLAAPQPGTPRVIIDFAGAPRDTFDEEGDPFWAGGGETIWHRPDGTWLLRYVDDRDGSFWTVDYDRAGTRLTIRWSSEHYLADIPSVLQGPVIAAALHLQGVPMLHASVLVVADGAIAMIGAPGAGKSTTATAFVARGFASMSDDLAPLRIDGSSVYVAAGYPRLRAYVDSARAAGFDGDALPRVFSAEFLGPKRYIELSEEQGSFHARELPLRAVYYLMPRRAGGGEPRIDSLTMRNALPVLLQNLYSTRFLDTPRRATVIRAMAGVAANVPVRTVQAGDDLTALPQLVDAIAADAAQIELTA